MLQSESYLTLLNTGMIGGWEQVVMRWTSYDIYVAKPNLSNIHIIKFKIPVDARIDI